MDKLHRDQSLVLQLAVCAFVGDKDARQHLDGEGLVVELRVLGEPDTPHPALAELAHNAVAIREKRTFCASLHRHRVVDGVIGHGSLNMK